MLIPLPKKIHAIINMNENTFGTIATTQSANVLFFILLFCKQSLYFPDIFFLKFSYFSL